MRALTATDVIRLRIRGLIPSLTKEYESTELQLAVNRLVGSIRQIEDCDEKIMELAVKDGYTDGWYGPKGEE